MSLEEKASFIQKGGSDGGFPGWKVSMQLLPTKINWSISESPIPLSLSPSMSDAATCSNIKKKKKKGMDWCEPDAYFEHLRICYAICIPHPFLFSLLAATEIKDKWRVYSYLPTHQSSACAPEGRELVVCAELISLCF